MTDSFSAIIIAFMIVCVIAFSVHTAYTPIVTLTECRVACDTRGVYVYEADECVCRKDSRR